MNFIFAILIILIRNRKEIFCVAGVSLKGPHWSIVGCKAEILMLRLTFSMTMAMSMLMAMAMKIDDDNDDSDIDEETTMQKCCTPKTTLCDKWRFTGEKDEALKQPG